MTPEFAALAARKEAEAIAARLEPWVTEDAGRTHGVEAIGNGWTRALFDGDFFVSALTATGPAAASLVFVQSRDGNTVAKDPSALGGGETDKHLVYEGLSRVAADAVLVGAETARGGGIVFSVWHPKVVALRESLGLPRHPAQIVATERGIALDKGVLFNEPELRVILLTVPAAAKAMEEQLANRPWISAVVMRDARDPRSELQQLRRLGIRRLSCVGGRTLANALLAADLIQDLYLTTSAKSGGEPNTPLEYRRGEIVVRKRGTGADEGVVFEHIRVGMQA